MAGEQEGVSLRDIEYWIPDQARNDRRKDEERGNKRKSIGENDTLQTKNDESIDKRGAEKT